MRSASASATTCNINAAPPSRVLDRRTRRRTYDRLRKTSDHSSGEAHVCKLCMRAYGEGDIAAQIASLPLTFSLARLPGLVRQPQALQAGLGRAAPGSPAPLPSPTFRFAAMKFVPAHMHGAARPNIRISFECMRAATTPPSSFHGPTAVDFGIRAAQDLLISCPCPWTASIASDTHRNIRKSQQAPSMPPERRRGVLRRVTRHHLELSDRDEGRVRWVFGIAARVRCLSSKIFVFSSGFGGCTCTVSDETSGW